VKGKPSRPSYEPPAPAPAPPRNDPRHDHRIDPRSDPKYHLDEDQTPRVQRPASQAVKQSPYFGLQDAPSPSGRLSDRIQRLKQRYDTLYCYSVLYITYPAAHVLSAECYLTATVSHSFTSTDVFTLPSLVFNTKHNIYVIIITVPTLSMPTLLDFLFTSLLLNDVS
jgi:hypothetical protein